MSSALGRVAREMREQRGFTQLDVASRAGVSEPTVGRFEAGTGWRRETDAIVAAYAVEAGVTAADIWRAAVEQAS